MLPVTIALCGELRTVAGPVRVTAAPLKKRPDVTLRRVPLAFPRDSASEHRRLVSCPSASLRDQPTDSARDEAFWLEPPVLLQASQQLHVPMAQRWPDGHV